MILGNIAGTGESKQSGQNRGPLRGCFQVCSAPAANRTIGKILCSGLARLYPLRGLFQQRLHTVTWGMQRLCTPLQGKSPFSATDLHFFRMTMAPMKPVRYN